VEGLNGKAVAEMAGRAVVRFVSWVLDTFHRDDIFSNNWAGKLQRRESIGSALGDETDRAARPARARWNHPSVNCLHNA
jgi:hypothetical protein